MLKETILTVQICDLKVDINYDGCVKKIKNIMHKIDGVYETNVNREQGKVTVTGVMDMDTVFKKLKKAGMSAQLWDTNSAAASKHQKVQLGGNDIGDQLKDASGKGLPQGEASSNAGCGARSGGSTNDATMVLPQLTLEQHLPNLQQQIEQRLQTLKGEKLRPHLLGMPPAINRGSKQSGKKIGGGTKALVPENANNDNKKEFRTYLLTNKVQAKTNNTTGDLEAPAFEVVKMLKETILTVQICDLKVDINCDGCVKKIKNIMHKIDGVYKTDVNREQGKVTVTGVMDMDTVFKKLKKAGMSAQLWDTNSAAASKHQKVQLGGNDMGDQLKDASGKGLPQGEASSSAGCGARSGGSKNDATVVLPQLTLEQHLPNLQQQIEQRLQTLKGEKLRSHLLGMPPAINRGSNQSGKKIGGGTKALVPGNANNDNKKDVGTKLHQDVGGSQVKNGGIGQPPHNSALGSLNNCSQAKKDSSVCVGSQMMGGSMASQKGGMMRPINNMIGPASFPNMGQMGGMSICPGGYNDVQPSYGGSAVHGMPANSLPGDKYYPGGARSNGLEMMQQVAMNPMLQQPNRMMVQPQQEHEMMMNTHSPHSENAYYYGPGCTGYQLMAYDNGHGHLKQQYPPQMYYPMPLSPQHDNNFSDESPNICSFM